MGGMTQKFEGGCLCGAVRFTTTGQPKGVYWCHCQSCRKHSGACVGFCCIRTQRLYGHARRDNEVRFDAGANPARVLRPMRINIDLRKRRLADGNTFLCRRI